MAEITFQKWKSNNIHHCTCRKCHQSPLGYAVVLKLTQSRHLRKDRELIAALDNPGEEDINEVDSEDIIEDDIDNMGIDDMSVYAPTRFGH